MTEFCKFRSLGTRCESVGYDGFEGILQSLRVPYGSSKYKSELNPLEVDRKDHS